MNISSERLSAEAQNTGFRPEILEKVAHLLNLLDALQSHPFLKKKLVLKGGTALNLFIFNIPRLSVDIDLNYVGAQSREAMLEERPKFERAVQAVFKREGFKVRRMPEEHAGGKWSLHYKSSLGQGGKLEVDINFMFRVPLWPVKIMDSRQLGIWQATNIPVIDIHELAAGKLTALLSRRKARDLFDSNKILQLHNLDPEKLRIAFIVYGAMNRKDWRTVSINDVDFDATEFSSQLIPMLRTNSPAIQADALKYGTRLIDECRKALSIVLPVSQAEGRFLDLLLDKGIIDATLIAQDENLRKRIKTHPLLQWKALNVKQHNKS